MNHIAPAMIAAVVAALLAAAPAAALPIDRTITVQPIDVCDSAGANCAGIDTILAATRGATAAIYAQAGIGIAYLPTRTFNDSTYTTTTVVQDGATDEARQLLRLPGHQQSANPQVLNLFAVPSLVDSTGISDPAKARTLFGFAFTNGNGIIIGANPRLDTIAHEIGHNLGLNHTTFGAGGGENLLTDGGSRTIPGQVSDIGTTDRLTPAIKVLTFACLPGLVTCNLSGYNGPAGIGPA